jgi:cell division protein FtsI (penicillin-binding protein 3)
MVENDRRREILRATLSDAEVLALEASAPIHPEAPSTPVIDDPLATSPLVPVEEDTPAGVPKRVMQYLPVSGVLNDAQLASFRAKEWTGVYLERVAVREYPGGATVASIVGKVGVDQHGTVGMESLLSSRLEGERGEIRYVRDAGGRPLWISPGDVKPAIHGGDVRLSIDLEIQRIAWEEIFRGVQEYEAAGGRVVVLDPATGEILAMVDVLRPVPEAIEYPFVPIGHRPSPGEPEYVPDTRYKVLRADPAREIHPALGRNRCVEAVYEPGSTFKAFVWAVVTELGKVAPSEVLDTESGEWHTGYGRTIRDVKHIASQTWTDILINSSNIGMGKGAERLTFSQLRDAVRRYGFGSKTGIGLAGESAGLVTPIAKWKLSSQHSVAFGDEIAVTPVQMVRAFSVFARQGEWTGTLPTLRILAANDEELRSEVVYRVLPRKIALLTRDAMTHVAGNMEAAMARKSASESVWRYNIFGKSGTSKIPTGKPPEGMRLPLGTRGYIEKQYTSSFIGAGPTESPRLVVLAIIDDPGPKLTHTNQAYGALTAGPVCRRVMERALMYLGTPASPGNESIGKQVALDATDSHALDEELNAIEPVEGTGDDASSDSPIEN